MTDTREKWQEIANRGLQDRFDPDTRAKFDEAVRRGLITMPNQQPQFQSESEIPIENEIGLPFAPKPQQQSSLADKAIGVAETVGAVGTGMTTGAFGYVSGVLNQLSQEILNGDFGSMESANRVQQAAVDMSQNGHIIGGTYAPRGEVGQQYTENVGKAAEILTPIAPQLAELQMLRPNLPMKPRIKKPNAKQVMTQDMIDGGIPGAKNSTAKYKLVDPDGNMVAPDFDWRNPKTAKSQRPFELSNLKRAKDPNAVALMDQGFDKGMIPPIRNASKIDILQMKKQAAVAEKMMNNDIFKMTESPLDVVGESLRHRFEFLLKERRVTGNKVGEAVKSLRGKPVDFSPAIDNFNAALESMGVKVNTKGSYSLNYDDSIITGTLLRGSRRAINDVVNQMKSAKGTPDAWRVHNLKKALDEVLEWGSKKGKDGFAGKTEGIIQSLRRDLDGVLDGNFPQYDKANTEFATIANGLEKFNDILGKKIDFNDISATKQLGQQLRKLGSNYGSKYPIFDAVNVIDDVANQFNGKFKDDLIVQVMFGNKLNKRFKLDGDNTFKALTTQAELDAFTKGGMIRKGYEGVRGMYRNDAEALKALNKYLDELNKVK